MAVYDYSPNVAELVLYQGDDWSKTYRLGSRLTDSDPIVYWDLTGWSGKSQIRKKAGSTEVLAELTFSLGEGQDTEEGAGYFTVSLSSDDSALLPRVCYWDVELTDSDGKKRTYEAGKVTVVREVTV